jgi:hypothetical protein
LGWEAFSISGFEKMRSRTGKTPFTAFNATYKQGLNDMKTSSWDRLILVLLSGCACNLNGQTAINLTQQGRLDSGTVLPAHCAAGQIFFKSDAPAGANLYVCASPDVWNGQQGTPGPAGAIGPQGSQGPAGPTGASAPIGGIDGQLTYNNAGTAAGSSLTQNGDGSLTANAGFNEKVCTLDFSTDPVFDAAGCNRFELGVLTASITGSTALHLKAGLHLWIRLTQDAVGGWTMTWPAAFINMCQPWPGPDTTTIQEADVMADGVTVRGAGCTSDAAGSSLAAGYLSESYPVGSIPITANTWVKVAAGKLTPLAGSESIHGVAPFACAANAASCEVAVAGQVKVIAEGSISQDHYLIRGAVNPANALDSGQATQTTLCSSARIGGRALESRTSGQLTLLQLFAPGMQGAAVCPHDVAVPLTCMAATSSGAAYTCTTSPIFIPAAGDAVLFKPDVTNTGAATLVVNSQAGTPEIRKQGGGTALAAKDLRASQYVFMIFDGANWQMQGQSANAADRVRACIVDNDTQSATPLTAAQFSGGCSVPAAATISEVDVWGGTGVVGGTVVTSGAGSVNLQRFTPSGGSSTTILSGNLATASGQACALTSAGGTCANGNVSSGSIAISTTSLSAGDWIRVSAATPDGAQSWYRIAVIYTIN